MKVESFPPIAGRGSRVLVLGSMPGIASLRAQQYYAHPQNRFWPIMAEALGFDPALPYARRVAALRRAGVAVWDVMQSCSRASSLDADIVEASIVPNDFAGFLSAHPKIEALYFNGAKAQQSFQRYVAKQVPAAGGLPQHRLPSTSPAHAAMRPEEKLRIWKRAILSVRC